MQIGKPLVLSGVLTFKIWLRDFNHNFLVVSVIPLQNLNVKIQFLGVEKNYHSSVFLKWAFILRIHGKFLSFIS